MLLTHGLAMVVCWQQQAWDIEFPFPTQVTRQMMVLATNVPFQPSRQPGSLHRRVRSK
jgi:hypothetical protein